MYRRINFHCVHSVLAFRLYASRCLRVCRCTFAILSLGRVFIYKGILYRSVLSRSGSVHGCMFSEKQVGCWCFCRPNQSAQFVFKQQFFIFNSLFGLQEVWKLRVHTIDCMVHTIDCMVHTIDCMVNTQWKTVLVTKWNYSWNTVGRDLTLPWSETDTFPRSLVVATHTTKAFQQCLMLTLQCFISR